MVAGLIAFIGGIIGIFLAIATVEGVASFLLLATWIACVWGASSLAAEIRPGNTTSSIGTAMAVTFFALMGMAVDQTGNYFYNYPLQWIFCPAGSVLNRGINVLHPLPGRTDIIQDFACMSGSQTVYQIGMGELIVFRFVEYLVIAYVVMWGVRGYRWIRKNHTLKQSA
jgi:hypothetical protein